MTDLLDVGIYAAGSTVLDSTTLIASLDRRQGNTWMVELNTPGTGQFTIHLDDPVKVANPTLLDDGNIVVVTRLSDGWVEKTWKIEARTPVPIGPGEKAGRLVTVSGRGLEADAEKALVWPYVFAQATTSDVRIFGFASPEPLSASGDSSTWIAPLGVRQDAGALARIGNPKGWTDHAAQWVSPGNPSITAPIGRFYFRCEFTLTDDALVLIEATFDNAGELWIDGERIIIGNSLWENYPFSRVESAGTHVIGGYVDNVPIIPAGLNNPTAVLFTVNELDANGDPTSTNFVRSTPSSTIVTSGTPGWTIGAILIQLFTEAIDRGVTSVQGITFGFSKTVDSNGDPWDVTDELPLKIGDDLGKVIDQATELACDVWMDGFVLQAAPRRGTDRTGTVEFAAGDNIIVSAPTFRAGGKVNAALISYNSRWLEVTDPATIGDYRAEVFLQLGSVESATQAVKMALASFVETSTPEITIPIQISSAKGPLPGGDFFLGDTTTGPGLDEIPAPLRVMAWTGSENEGEIRYDVACYPEG